MKKIIKTIAVLALVLSLATVVCTAETSPARPVRVAALKGPTGMAVAHMMKQNEGAYEFLIESQPANVNALIISGQADIAAVPINAGAVLYNKTEGGVKALSLITRGMLYVLEKGDSIHSVSDLAGKTVVAAGQGATPEYVTEYILAANGIEATLETEAEHAAVASKAIEGLADIVLLPEPMVTNVLMKNPDFRIALDITEEFAAAAKLNDILFSANPASVGGKAPDEAYYLK